MRSSHETRHTLGSSHPNGPPHKVGYLTMYAYGELGEAQKRTLGDGVRAFMGEGGDPSPAPGDRILEYAPLLYTR